jgi:Protein of unknown function (DUF3105)
MMSRMRPALSFVAVSLLSGVALGPAACSGSDGHPNEIVGGAASSAAGERNVAGKAGHAAAGSTSAGGGGANGSAGSPSEGGSTGGTVADAGMAGVALGGSAGTTGEGGGPELGSSGAAGECAAVVTSCELSPGIHVTACTPIDYATNPPSSGEHYPTWADFGVYDFALPRGYWMHNLEHGAVVVTYHCPAGCDADIAKAKAWLAQLTPDATCPAGPPRVLLVPDPLLDVPWAASSWGFTLKAQCFDADAFSSFYGGHAGQAIAPEAALCGTGFDFRAEGADTCGAK